MILTNREQKKQDFQELAQETRSMRTKGTIRLHFQKPLDAIFLVTIFLNHDFIMIDLFYYLIN